MASGDEVIGVSAEKAARICGLSIHQLAAWEQLGLVRPRARGQYYASLTPSRVYGLDELVELKIVAELQAHNLSTKRIRTVVDAFRSMEHPRPLRQLRWAVEGRQVFVEIDGVWYGDRRPSQGVMHNLIDLDYIVTTTRRAALARGGTPGTVERRARSLGGKEVFAGTRTPVDAVRSYIRRGYSDDRILAAFPHLTVEDIAFARDGSEPIGA